MYPRVICWLSRGYITIAAIALAAGRLMLGLLAAILRERPSNVVLLVRKVALFIAANVPLIAGFRFAQLSFCHRGPPKEANGA
jgi:hypothetical protein